MRGEVDRKDRKFIIFEHNVFIIFVRTSIWEENHSLAADVFLRLLTNCTILSLIFLWLNSVNFGKECKQDDRLPTAYFPPPNFVKDAFQKNESVFFYFKKYPLFIKICNFFKFKNFLVSLPKITSQLEWKKHFQEIISFHTHSTGNLQLLPTLKKKSGFFSKKTQNFLNQTQISYVFEKSYYFSRILRQICCNLVIKNFQSQNRPDRTLSARTIGK